MERERGVVQQPPSKRMKLAPAVPIGVVGGEVASPRSRISLRQTLLAVLFLVRARTTVTASIYQIGRMLPRYVDRTFHKYHGMISSKLDGFQEQIEGLRHEVTQLSRLCSNCHADQQTRLEANQERVSADGLNTNIQLRFQNDLKPPVYTDENVTSENNAAIKLAMFEGDKVVTSGARSQVKVEILVLRGDFSNKCRDNWTEEEFDKYIVQGRDGHDLVLRTVWLNKGEVELSQIRFKEGSCRKKFIMAARVCKSENISGRIQEAIMKPVIVLDRRNKQNEKRHPPKLDDDLYRLEEIARDGVYHKRLQEARIYKVEGFLKALIEDSKKLRGILKMEKQENAWLKLTEHARECVLQDRQELKRYQCEEGNVVLFFNCVHDVVGAAFPHEYVAWQRFGTAQKALLNKWRWHAYDKLEGISADFVMKGNIPEPISSRTDVAVAPSVLAMGAPQQIFSDTNQLAPYQGTGAAEYLPHDEHVMGLISPIANRSITVPDDQGIPPHGPQQMTATYPQNPQGLMDFSDPIELANLVLYPDSVASTSAHLPQPGSAVPAAAPPWMTAQPPIPEQDQGPTYSGFRGSGYPNHFRY